MNSAGRDANYYIKRQKKNEEARISRMKRKDKEIQAESDRKNLEAAYVKLHKELRQIYEKRLENLYTKGRVINASLSLKEHYNRPTSLLLNYMDQLVRGLSTQNTQKVDICYLLNTYKLLIQCSSESLLFGMDIVSLDIQRSRDHGIPSYTEFRKYCRLKAMRSVHDLSRILVEVGRLNTQKLNEKYDIGQLFFHQIFGYRGVILFPWLVTLYDFDDVIEADNAVGKVIKGKTHTYYQTLIDERDYPFIRVQTEPVTCLGNQDTGHSSYATLGLDYVAQEDILPYTATEKQPFQHIKSFNKFLKYNPKKDPPFRAQGKLQSWQKKNHPWLELSDVHKETTENVRITVMSFFVGYRESQTLYLMRYCIRLENVGEQSVQLRERHWRIFSLSGTLETIRGRGVVSQEPILSKKSPVFQYISYVSLEAPIGHMWGTFQMEREDGYLFDCRIPLISLKSKSYYGDPFLSH